jgi:hypothetical protein
MFDLPPCKVHVTLDQTWKRDGGEYKVTVTPYRTLKKVLAFLEESDASTFRRQRSGTTRWYIRPFVPLLFYPEDRSSKFLRNSSNFQTDYTISHPGRIVSE